MGFKNHCYQVDVCLFWPKSLMNIICSWFRKLKYCQMNKSVDSHHITTDCCDVAVCMLIPCLFIFHDIVYLYYILHSDIWYLLHYYALIPELSAAAVYHKRLISNINAMNILHSMVSFCLLLFLFSWFHLHEFISFNMTGFLTHSPHVKLTPTNIPHLIQNHWITGMMATCKNRNYNEALFDQTWIRDA